MKTQQDQGYHQTEDLYLDAKLQTWVEAELLQDQVVDSRAFAQVLAVLVDEFGCQYRRIENGQQQTNLSPEQHLQMCQQDCQRDQQVSIHRGSTKAVLDQYGCAIPSCIFETLVDVVLAERNQEQLSFTASTQQEAELLQSMAERAQRLLGFEPNHIEICLPEMNVACIAQARARKRFVSQTEGLAKAAP